MASKVLRELYTYAIRVASIAPAVTVTDQIQIQSDARFVWQSATMFASLAGAAQTESSAVVPQCNVLITNTGSGRQLSNIALPISAYFGTGRDPKLLVKPYQFYNSTAVKFEISNISNAETYTNLYLLLHGQKIFQM